jgi:uncharacterized FAD-dependent dehydrogenase
MEEKIVEISIRPELRDDHLAIRTTALKKVGLKDREELDVKVIRRSIDARKKNPRYICKVSIGTSTDNTTSTRRRYPDVTSGKAVHIIGAGPAGYFAALELIKNGFKPIVFERGKDVQERRRDLRAIQQDGLVDPNSNSCFGEGGAGTYSDGKLYTRATKRGDVGEVLRILVDHGANPEILVEAHPHIGSNKLPQIVAAIRESILASGGEVRFGSRLTDLHVEGDRIAQIVINEDEEIPVNDVILCGGGFRAATHRRVWKRGTACGPSIIWKPGPRSMPSASASRAAVAVARIVGGLPRRTSGSKLPCRWPASPTCKIT